MTGKVVNRYWINPKSLDVILAKGVIFDNGQFATDRGRTVIPRDKHHESAEEAIDSYIAVIELTLEKLKAQKARLSNH